MYVASEQVAEGRSLIMVLSLNDSLELKGL